MAWTSATVGDFDGALQGASVSLEQLRGQDEPFWTAVAVATVGSVEVIVGRYDDARRHLSEARDLGDRFDNAWLTAGSRAQLGALAVARGRPDEAQALLDEGLGLSLAGHSTQNVTLPASPRYCSSEAVTLFWNPTGGILSGDAGAGVPVPARERRGYPVRLDLVCSTRKRAGLPGVVANVWGMPRLT